MNREIAVETITPVGEQDFDVKAVRADFPILSANAGGGKPLVYLDNAATSQKPTAVIERITRYYNAENSNVHRGVHYLSQKATDDYEAARETIRKFINARKSHEVIFTRGTTESLNIVAASFGRHFVRAGDEIIISAMEHHSNIVAWQMLCEDRGATLRVIPITDSGELMLDKFQEMLTARTKLVSLVHVSNTLGTINPVEEIIERAHARNVPVCLDGAQAVPHMKVDVRDLDCDFYCFSAHKVFGPTGAGILYGKERLLDEMPPFLGGGNMIGSVTFDKTTYNELPHKFEAGTPHIAGGIGMAAGLEYLSSLGWAGIGAHERDLLEYATDRLDAIEGLKIIGTSDKKACVISFLIEGVHPYDAGMILDQFGVAVRTGHHCTQPIMKRFGIHSTIRASFALYNTRQDVDVLIEGIRKAIEMLK